MKSSQFLCCCALLNWKLETPNSCCLRRFWQPASFSGCFSVLATASRGPELSATCGRMYLASSPSDSKQFGLLKSWWKHPNSSMSIKLRGRAGLTCLTPILPGVRIASLLLPHLKSSHPPPFRMTSSVAPSSAGTSQKTEGTFQIVHGMRHGHLLAV